jgi:hypothetical protein
MRYLENNMFLILKQKLLIKKDIFQFFLGQIYSVVHKKM